MNSVSPIPRSARVGAEVAHALAGLIERQCDDPRLRLVTVTEVRMSPDLKQARVLVSSADPDAACDDTLAVLRHAGTRLRRELAERVRLRSVPRLDFVWDHRSEDTLHLDALIARGLPAHDDQATQT
ncbi:MAG: 30S ribosome-binding factor RbfA [Gammaproteobacteria bacterium]